MNYTLNPLPTREWFIPMHPQAKERPRIAGGFAFTPQKTLDAEATIKEFLLNNNYYPVYLGEHSIEIKIQMKDGKRGDIDNYIKTILDGINHSKIWYDDKDVIKMKVKFEFIDDDNEGIYIKLDCFAIESKKVKERIKRRMKKIEKDGETILHKGGF